MQAGDVVLPVHTYDTIEGVRDQAAQGQISTPPCMAYCEPTTDLKITTNIMIVGPPTLVWQQAYTYSGRADVAAS